MLNYIEAYGVAVCTDCQYAVQPAALSSHLLRHRIYRKERRAELDRFKDVKLLDPDDVPIPPPSIQPIAGIPVHDGRRCTADNCGYTCVSEKRMQQHWSEQHGETTAHDRPTRLQTFFRGNKLRYFEVAQQPGQTPAITHTNSHNDFYFADRKPSSTESPVTRPPSQPDPRPPFNGQSFDMDTLRLLHHYTCETCLGINRGVESVEFLRVVIPRQAFEIDFLLSAILAIAALHLAVLTPDATLSRRYRLAANRHQSYALPGYRNALMTPTTENSNALIMCSRVIGIHNTTELQLEALDAGPDYIIPREEATMSLVELWMLLRGSVDTLVDMQSILPPDSEFVQPPEVLEDMLKLAKSSSGVGSDDTNDTNNATPPVFSPPAAPELAANELDHLLLLRDHLAAITFRDNSRSTTQLIQAFNALRQSVQRAISATEAWQLWNAIEIWPRLVPTTFTELLAQADPAALLMYAYWLTVFRRIERLRNHWFMAGQVERLTGLIRMLLSEEHHRYLPDLTPHKLSLTNDFG